MTDADAGARTGPGARRVKAAGILLAVVRGAGPPDHAGAVHVRGTAAVDLVLVVVVYVALTVGPGGRAADGNLRRAGAGRPGDRGHRHRRAGQDPGRVSGRASSDAVHRGAAAAPVSGVFRGDAAAFAGFRRAVRAARSAALWDAIHDRGRAGRGQCGWSGSWRFSWSNCCQERWNGGGPQKAASAGKL